MAEPQIITALRAQLPSDVWTLEHDSARAAVLARRIGGALAFQISAYVPIESTGGGDGQTLIEGILHALSKAVREGHTGVWRLLVLLEYEPEGPPKWAMRVTHPLDV